MNIFALWIYFLLQECVGSASNMTAYFSFRQSTILKQNRGKDMMICKEKFLIRCALSCACSLNCTIFCMHVQKTCFVVEPPLQQTSFRVNTWTKMQKKTVKKKLFGRRQEKPETQSKGLKMSIPAKEEDLKHSLNISVHHAEHPTNEELNKERVLKENVYIPMHHPTEGKRPKGRDMILENLNNTFNQAETVTGEKHFEPVRIQDNHNTSLHQFKRLTKDMRTGGSDVAKKNINHTLQETKRRARGKQIGGLTLTHETPNITFPQTKHPTKGNRTTRTDLVIDNLNMTLHHACAKGELAVVRYLLFHGDDINSRATPREGGWTPVMAAAWHGQLAVFDFLVNQGCDLSIVDNEKDTVLHIACMGGSTTIVKRLVNDMNFNRNIRGYRGRTPLMRTVESNHTDLFDYLIRIDCNPRATDDYGDNILHIACMSGYGIMVKHILSLKLVDIESKGFCGKTLVMFAAQFGRTTIFKFLARRGCNLKAITGNGDSILHVSCIGGYLPMVKYIMSLKMFRKDSRGFKGSTPAMVAAEYGRIDVLDFFVRLRYNVRAVDRRSYNILHMACIGGHVDMVKHILLMKIIGIESRGYLGRTPVMVACFYGNRAVVQFLARSGCNLRARDHGGKNLVDVASIKGHTDVMKYIRSLMDVAR